MKLVSDGDCIYLADWIYYLHQVDLATTTTGDC